MQPPRKVRTRLHAVNPVARSIAWSKMVADATHVKALLWALQDGDDCRGVVCNAGNFIASSFVASRHCKLYLNPGKPDAQIWHEALRVALARIAELEQQQWHWRKELVVAFDDGLDAACLVAKHADPHSIQYAAREWGRMSEDEHRGKALQEALLGPDPL